MDDLYTTLDNDQSKVSAHPNIVEMVTVFADQVPGLPGDIQLYGDALPSRLNPRVYWSSDVMILSYVVLLGVW